MSAENDLLITVSREDFQRACMFLEPHQRVQLEGVPYTLMFPVDSIWSKRIILKMEENK